MKVCAAGAAPPQALPLKSTVAVGHPLRSPTPPWPLKASDVRLVPQTAPRHGDGRRRVRGRRGVRREARGETEGVARRDVPASAGESENCASVGVPRVTEAAALPVLDRVRLSEAAAWFSCCMPKLALVAEPVAQASVAPVGRDRERDGGVRVRRVVGRQRQRAAERGARLRDDAGTTAVMVMVPVAPGRTLSVAGEAEKTEPAMLAPTVSGRGARVLDAERRGRRPVASPQLPAPSSMRLDEKTAVGPSVASKPPSPSTPESVEPSVVPSVVASGDPSVASPPAPSAAASPPSVAPSGAVSSAASEPESSSSPPSPASPPSVGLCVLVPPPPPQPAAPPKASAVTTDMDANAAKLPFARPRNRIIFIRPLVF